MFPLKSTRRQEVGPLMKDNKGRAGAEIKVKKKNNMKRKKKGKTSKLLLKLQMHPKAVLVCYDSACSFQTAYSSISCPHRSKWQQKDGTSGK